MVVFGQSGCIGAKWLYSGKSDCIRAEVVVFRHTWLYSSKSCCDRAEVVVIGQKWFYSGKAGVFGQCACIWAKMVVFGAKVVVFWQSR